MQIAGITPLPDTRWLTQSRDLTDPQDGFLRSKGYLILDRDTKYSDASRTSLAVLASHVIRLPPQSANLNAFAERFVRSIRAECV